jgi:hypothetical protein
LEDTARELEECKYALYRIFRALQRSDGHSLRCNQVLAMNSASVEEYIHKVSLQAGHPGEELTSHGWATTLGEALPTLCPTGVAVVEQSKVRVLKRGLWV